MNNHNILSIDEAKFLKTSKKLLSQINNDLISENTSDYKSFKLSQIQEILAHSLGFRNLNDLQNFFSKEKSVSESQLFYEDKKSIFYGSKPSIFYNIELDQAIQIISNLMSSSGSGDMWRSRAISLLSSVFQALIYMRDQQEILLDVDCLREYLILENIFKLYKTRRDFPGHIRNDLRSYLVSLPGFQESAPKQNDTVMEQHGYLQMQFFSALNRLKNIEKDNFIIADQSWFNMEVKHKVLSASGGTNQKTIEKTKEYKSLTIHPALIEFDFLEDSWLSMEEYAEWVVSLEKKGQLNQVRVSDLLIYVTTIISPIRSAKMYLVLNSILDNYSIASQVSAQICAKLKSI